MANEHIRTTKILTKSGAKMRVIVGEFLQLSFLVALNRDNLTLKRQSIKQEKGLLEDEGEVH